MWLFDAAPLRDYGPYRSGPRKLVVHTPEFPDSFEYGGANSFDAYVEAVKGSGKRASYHVVAAPIQRRIIQFASLDKVVGGLKHPDARWQTNGDSAIQVSILGYARDMRDLNDGHLDWLADEVFEPIFRTYPDIDFMEWPYGSATNPEGAEEEIDWWFDGDDINGILASADSPIRFSYPRWDSFGGVCGHQHVPGNDHWDPGHFDYPYIAQRIEEKVKAAGLNSPAPSLQSPITIIDVASAPDGGTWCLLEDGGIANFSGAPYYGHMLDPVTLSILGVPSGYSGKPRTIVPNTLRGYTVYTDDDSMYVFYSGTYQ